MYDLIAFDRTSLIARDRDTSDVVRLEANDTIIARVRSAPASRVVTVHSHDGVNATALEISRNGVRRWLL